MKIASTHRALAAALISMALASSALAQSAGADTLPAAGERRGPPPESIAACKAAALNQACSFTVGARAEKGSCFQPDASKPLACRPARSGPPPESLAACKTLKLNDACAFAAPEGPAKGSCTAAESGVLGCRPHRK